MEMVNGCIKSANVNRRKDHWLFFHVIFSPIENKCLIESCLNNFISKLWFIFLKQFLAMSVSPRTQIRQKKCLQIQ